MTNSNSRVINSAVLVPLYRNDKNDLIIVLIRRSDIGIHGGQIAFPGGKHEPTDTTFLDTALRESEEEIGINPRTVEILETLPTVDTHVTGFRIYPFLAKIKRPVQWECDEQEVVEVLEIPLNDLLKPEVHDEEIMEQPQWPGPRKLPFYHVGQYKLWGASYKIIHPVLPRLASGEWQV
jgi:8-oxo-dGTP pyrophosphatase MutT (NUDIX family)